MGPYITAYGKTSGYRGKQTVVRIQIFMDDTDAPEVAFFTDPELAKQIDKTMLDFIEELAI